MAARLAAELCSKQAYVVETHTPPQGVAAMFAFNPEQGAAENARQMQAMAAQVHTIEVTTAVRDAHINGVAVQERHAIALVDGALCCSGQDVNQAALQALSALLAEEEADVVTLYFGQPVQRDGVQRLAQEIESRHPDVEVEWISGGQPHYHYIISVE